MGCKVSRAVFREERKEEKLVGARAAKGRGDMAPLKKRGEAILGEQEKKRKGGVKAIQLLASRLKSKTTKRGGSLGVSRHFQEEGRERGGGKKITSISVDEVVLSLKRRLLRAAASTEGKGVRPVGLFQIKDRGEAIFLKRGGGKRTRLEDRRGHTKARSSESSYTRRGGASSFSRGKGR